MLRRLKRVEAALHAAVEGVLTRSYVDTGPIVERVFAKYAGVGWIGKNTCVINQQKGSWLFLGVILTSVELTADVPAPDRCGTCTRCIEACPTDALLRPYELDSNRCISYLTIEKRGSIPEEMRAGHGAASVRLRHLPGRVSVEPEGAAFRGARVRGSRGLVNPALEWLAEMSAEEFREKFRGSPIRRAKFAGLRRNVAIAMGNSGSAGICRRTGEDEPRSRVVRGRKCSLGDQEVDGGKWGLCRCFAGYSPPRRAKSLTLW